MSVRPVDGSLALDRPCALSYADEDGCYGTLCSSVNADKQKSGHKGQARLIFNGKQLSDDDILAECGIEKDSCIHMVLRLSGC